MRTDVRVYRVEKIYSWGMKRNIKVVAAIAVVLSSSSAQSGGRGGGEEGKLNDPCLRGVQNTVGGGKNFLERGHTLPT